MLNEMRRINIFTGNFGSGKTEIALNFAMELHRQGREVTVVDLDIINPYFRTRVVKDRLAALGVDVVCPDRRLMNADLPALSPAIRGVLEGNRGYGAIDVGGDEIGTTVLGRFRNNLTAGAFHLFLVVNTCRPFTRDVEGIIRQMDGIERAARVKVTALVSNTNLGPGTGLETVRAGHRIVAGAAAELGLPVAFAGARRELAPSLQDLGVPVLPLDFYMKPPWPNGDFLIETTEEGIIWQE